MQSQMERGAEMRATDRVGGMRGADMTYITERTDRDATQRRTRRRQRLCPLIDR